MTQISFKQITKEFLQELLIPLGNEEINFEVPSESQSINVWLQPAIVTQKPLENLTLLERISNTPCTFEIFHSPPSWQELRRCLFNLLWLQETEFQQNDPIPDEQLPTLWVLASSLPGLAARDLFLCKPFQDRSRFHSKFT
jgi:hypothetical protein